jgi:hypothetical protein
MHLLMLAPGIHDGGSDRGRWHCGGGRWHSGGRQHCGAGRREAFGREELGNRGEEATKMPIPHRRQNSRCGNRFPQKRVGNPLVWLLSPIILNGIGL